jgi:hypothetical protein
MGFPHTVFTQGQFTPGHLAHDGVFGHVVFIAKKLILPEHEYCPDEYVKPGR